MAFGDAQNDKSMVEYVGLGVAMGNASDELKAVANEITDTNNNIVKGGEAIAKDENHVFTYNLSGTIIDTKYRIYIASDANAQLGGWTLVYE